MSQRTPQGGAAATRTRLHQVLQAGKERAALIDAKRNTSTPVTSTTGESLGVAMDGISAPTPEGTERRYVGGRTKSSETPKYKTIEQVTIAQLTDRLVADFKKTATLERFKDRVKPYDHELDTGVGVFARVYVVSSSLQTLCKAARAPGRPHSLCVLLVCFASFCASTASWNRQHTKCSFAHRSCSPSPQTVNGSPVLSTRRWITTSSSRH